MKFTIIDLRFSSFFFQSVKLSLLFFCKFNADRTIRAYGLKRFPYLVIETNYNIYGFKNCSDSLPISSPNKNMLYN